MKVSVDKDLCVGCGLCESSCPDVFEMKDNVAVVKRGDVAPAQADCATSVAQNCPVSAITVEG